MVLRMDNLFLSVTSITLCPIGDETIHLSGVEKDCYYLSLNIIAFIIGEEGLIFPMCISVLNYKCIYRAHGPLVQEVLVFSLQHHINGQC